MDALPSICTLSYGNTVVNVQHLPFHVGSSPNMDLQIGEDFFSSHQFSLSTDITGRLHACVVDPSGLYVDGVYYSNNSPRILLQKSSTIGTQKLQLNVVQTGSPSVIERPVGFVSEKVLSYVGFNQ